MVEACEGKTNRMQRDRYVWFAPVPMPGLFVFPMKQKTGQPDVKTGNERKSKKAIWLFLGPVVMFKLAVIRLGRLDLCKAGIKPLEDLVEFRSHLPQRLAPVAYPVFFFAA